MQAYVLHGIGDIRSEEVPVPEISDSEVLVKVKAAGICGSDIPRIYKTGAYHHPLIPGHEFSGLVINTGKNALNWKNKRVGIFPLIPCGECLPCRNRQYEMCRKYSYLGSRRNGGFAEYAAVPSDNLIELPENVTYEEAAMLEPLSVAVHSIRRIDPQKTDTAAVCGLGTIGLFIIMLLKEIGVRNILAVGNKKIQKNKVMAMGVPEENCCDRNPGEWLKKKTSGNGVNVFFECVGKNETVVHAVENTMPGGKIMLVGNPYSDMVLEKPVYWKILRNQLTVMGTWNSSFTHDENDDWHWVLRKLSEKKISPAKLVSHRFSMNELEKGFRIMRDKSEDHVKILMGEDYINV